MDESDVPNLPSSDSEDSDEDRGFASMVLSLLVGGFICHQEEEPETVLDTSGLEEPDTVKESDLMQKVDLNLGKISNSSVDHNIVSNLADREISCCGALRKMRFSLGCCSNITSKLIPNKVCKCVPLRQKVFCGTFSEDGKIFLSACQDGYLRFYKSSDLIFNHYKPSKPFISIPAIDVGWSILDTAFSRDASYVVYSTWSSDIYISSVYDDVDGKPSLHKALDLKPDERNFAIFSLQFSADSNEILCGGSDGNLYIYDRCAQYRTLCISAHKDDVNAVCFADQSSHILYSGGDDGLVHVWDRRTLSENDPKSVGSFAGHLDGITFIDSHQDGRYLLSNSKDQTIKLWDLRQFSSQEAQHAVLTAASMQSWDYRWQSPPKYSSNQKKTVAGDTSVKTYHGHKVTNTLIRARFSPLHTTGQKYIYSGCSTGSVVIYDILTGEVVGMKKHHRHCVRDVSWHPCDPVIVSSSWDGTFAVWGYSSVENLEGETNRRKNAHGVGDKETGESQHRELRRSPRLARSGIQNI